MRSLKHHPIPHPLFSRSYPHERRNMRSVWPNGTVWEFRQHGHQTETHAVSANIPAEDIGAWVHLVGTYDGTSWNLYKNGELLASTWDTTGALTVNADWHIGSSNGNSRFFDGEIANVYIWNTALEASQAAEIYTASAFTYSPEEGAPPITIPFVPSGSIFSNSIPSSTTTYTYDALNRLTSLTDPVGNTTSYTYDYRGLVLTETNEKNATRYYTYDALGRLVSKTDRNDRVTTYAYDSVGRLTAEHWGDTSDYFMYTYDLVGNLLYATDGDHSYSYTYDSLYRPTHVSFNFDSQSAVFSYTYDAVGRQTSSSLTLNGHADRVNTTTYDYLGNATSIRQHGNAVDEIFAEFDYNSNGLLTSVRRYEKDDDTINEIAESLYTYNANNAITSITHKKPDETQIVQHSYTYDSTNNIVEYLNSIDGQTSYDYDFLGQLISADHANQTDESYIYDSNGNRITANGATYTTGTNNELTSDGNYTYTYDAEGNRISKSNSTDRELYEWDYRNRLTKVTQQTFNAESQTWETVQIVEYAYDYNNIWIRKVVGENKTIFIPENYQTAVQIDNGTVTHHYLWTPNAQDKLLADTTTDGVSWSLTDHLDTVRDILGSEDAHLIYDAFGNLISGTNPILFGFTGKAFDTDTNLQNNINRWYDAAVGRWIAEDPISFIAGDSNLTRYAGNQSINFKDRNGLERSSETLRFDPPPYFSNMQEVSYANTHIVISCHAAMREEELQRLSRLFPDGDVFSLPRDNISSIIHLGLDVIGLVPVFGEPADAFNSVIYWCEGDYVNAGLSAGSMIPVGGYFATGAKFGKRGIETCCNVLQESTHHTIKGRLKAAQLPTHGKIRFVPRKDYNPAQHLQRGPHNGYMDRFNNEWVPGPSRTPRHPFEWDVQLPPHGGDQIFRRFSPDGKHVNVTLDGHISH